MRFWYYGVDFGTTESIAVLQSPRLYYGVHFGYYGVESGTAKAILVLQRRFWYYNIEFGTDRVDFGNTKSTQNRFWGFMGSHQGPLGRVPDAQSGPKGATGGLIQRIRGQKMRHHSQEAEEAQKGGRQVVQNRGHHARPRECGYFVAGSDAGQGPGGANKAAKAKCYPRLHHRHFLGLQGQKYLVLKANFARGDGENRPGGDPRKGS